MQHNPDRNDEIPGSEPPYLQGLNPAQRAAVEALDGAVLVLAGAGTGKTRALTARLAHLIRTGRAWPSQILAVTFTNKAAQEMKLRVAALLGGQEVAGWWLGTFHALSARMLRAHAGLVGLTQDFTILDADDQIRLVKQLLEQENIDAKTTPPKALAGQFGRWKDRALGPGDVPAGEASSLADGRAAALYALYQQRLKSLNACDFGDLLLHVVTILRDPKNAEILSGYQRKFRYIMVDEYQDTNAAQYLWLRLLARGSGNLCCVGDDDQSIYGWRGAEIDNILRFEKDFPGARIIRLEQNYRSTGHILGAAGALIGRNESRLGKTLWSDSGAGEKVAIRGLWDGEAEARWVGEEVESLRKKGTEPGEIAILVRAGFQTRAFEERFIRLGIPYRVVGGLRFYERQEIRDALAYLRVVAQNADDLALERIVNLPRRGIGDSTIQALYAYARTNSVSLHEAGVRLVETDTIRGKAREALRKLLEDFKRWRGMLADTPHSELAAKILEESGYLAMWQAEKSPDAAGRVENLKELVVGMQEFESLPAFLEHVALVLETAEERAGGQVSIMTLHAAKGLEFDAVFLAGWEEGLFPSQRTMDEQGARGLEEERRLAYVGLTRAKKKAYVSYVASRNMYGRWIDALPSRFLEEIPPEHSVSSAEVGLYAPGRSRHWDSSGVRAEDSSPAHSATRTASGNSPSGTAEGFSRGQRVRHASFGPGTVIAVKGHKLDIAFDSGGTKLIMDSFVEAETQGG